MHTMLLGDFMPDITLWLDISPDITWGRVEKRQEQGMTHAFEVQKNFQKKVYEQYVKLHVMYPERIVRIDACQNVDKVFAEMTEKVGRILEI